MKKFSVRRHVQRGFTLIEIMVVVVIMGVLAALVVPKLLSRTGESKIAAAKVDIATIMQSLKLYKLDNQRYPTTEQGLQSLLEKPTSGPAANGWKTGGYLEKMPKDPWGNPYQYLSPGIKGEIDVFSYGADGQPGGTGDDADIGSWEN
ncbi:type II secretion system protein G (GspG) [Duganella sacchari]|uniref:Type II secretion system core protein G n=1 Tax=Duganella sacchari TaxID=551987 RepID=A0A1M7TBT7_9BURK|nr:MULTISPECIES: type II secretion system major pseudopilin GspG [Duganella]MYM29007.1 type II secretion system major pseudopilin GspG [Duganella sp. CY15W]SHN68137.1 type II secretion system protein G (GspG) [Duganella sacchari]